MKIDEFIIEVEKLGLEVTSDRLDKLNKYYDLLIEYNKIMNLTGITEKEEVYLKHFYDSLTLSKIIDLNEESTFCDLGSGAGFPGIVIKIFYPHLKVTLVDSLEKRIKFLNIVIEKLNLNNIYTVCKRIEEFSNENIEKYDIVTARAVAPLNILLELGIKLVKIDKYFIAMKGNLSNEQNYQKALNKLNCIQIKKIEFNLPIENSCRSLVLIQKIKNTPKLYPRKYSEIKKRPI